MDKEKVELQLKFTPNYKKYSILLNCYRVGGMKWNDVDGAIFHKIDLSKEDILFALGVKQQIADLEAKLAESEKTEDGAFWFEKWQHKKRDYDSVYKAYIENCAEVDQLKHQLAEKEKELHYKTAECEKWKRDYEYCSRLCKKLEYLDKEKDCPLKLIIDRLAEERKKVVELFKNMSTINNTTMDIVGKFYTIPEYLLNQIERGSNE